MATPRRLRRTLLGTLLALLPLLAGPVPALAQDLRLTLGGGADPAAGSALDGKAAVAIEGARVGATRVDLTLGYDGAAQLDLALQANDTFGPLGNVIGEGSLSIRTDGSARGALGARGVLGPVALGVRALAFGASAERFDPWAAVSPSRPELGGPGWGIALDASGRPSRALIVEVRPQLYGVTAGTAWRADARLRWLRAIGPHELSLRLAGYLAPTGRADAAVGIGFTYRRRGAPDLDGALYLGDSPAGLRPGITLTLAQPLGPVDASLDLAAEPYRLDVAPYRAHLELSTALGPGTAGLEAGAAAGTAGAKALLGVSYALPVSLDGP